MKEKKLKEEVESQLQLPMDKIKNLIEYHRTVHAEMEAITSCSRKGLKTKNSILYTTTYPCHNCAKHLVSAGVRKIIYIESYPKSLATDLHRDSIGPIEDTIQKMNIVGFQGVSPRRYLDFFSQTLSPGLIMERKGEGNFDKKPWNVSKFPPKEYDFKFSYRLNNLRALEAQTVTFLNPLLISQSKLVRYQRKKNKNSSAA